MKLVLMLMCLACCLCTAGWWRTCQERQDSHPQPGKPENRAMATRFYHNVLILLHWQAQLLDALVQVK
jgi:hypothetical protein